MNGLEIAVIGMSCRLPGAKNIEEYWRNIANGAELISFFKEKELAGGKNPDIVRHPDFVKAGGVLEEVEYFDSSFFRYTAGEAQAMDPQMRILHECCWEALEDAGYDPATYKARIGTYVGAASNMYWQILSHFSSEGTDSEQLDRSSLNDKDFIATRIAYNFNLSGPSYTLDTACSTSLAAIHEACQALLGGECEMALAGGATITLPQKSGYMYQEGFIASSDGHCKTFDDTSTGTVWSNGAGIVLLKPLADALKDRDPIHAVVKGTLINNDGAKKVSFAAPSVEGQSELIAVAHRMAEVEPETIGFVEAHGTGTRLGDPVEIEALRLAYHTTKKGYCAIGSAKSSIGHTDRAAGIAGFMKAVLALKHKMIPPTLHFNKPNAGIDFENSPFYVNDKLIPWVESAAHRRRAAVNSLGVGGTNAYAVLEEAPPQDETPTFSAFDAADTDTDSLIVLSGNSERAVRLAASQLLQAIRKHPQLDMRDVAYTLQIGRRELPVRLAFVCQDREEAILRLTEYAFGEEAGRSPAPMAKFQKIDKKLRSYPVIFSFQQGNFFTYITALELYRKEPQFRTCLNDCMRVIERASGLQMNNWFRSKADELGMLIESGKSVNDDTMFLELLQTSGQIALARLLLSWGIIPSAVMSSGNGHFAAAYVAGACALDDAITLLCAQIANKRHTANDNPLALLSDEAVCLGQSKMGRFQTALEAASFMSPQMDWLCAATGLSISTAQLERLSFWTDAPSMGVPDTLREVFSTQGSKEYSIMLHLGSGFFLETISQETGMGQAIESTAKAVELVESGSSVEGSAHRCLLAWIGSLWTMGSRVKWEQLHLQHEQSRKRVSLPTYPFERSYYWIDGDPFKLLKQYPSEGSRTELRKREEVSSWLYYSSWRQKRARELTEIDSARFVVLHDQFRIGDEIVNRLQQRGHAIVSVRLGNEYQRLSDTEYTINPEQYEGYASLCADWSANGIMPERIVYLWSISERDLTIEAVAASKQIFDREQTAGSYGLLHLMQGWEQFGGSHPLHVTVVVNRTLQVAGNDFAYPEKASIIGLSNVIPQEYPHISCRCIDLDHLPSETELIPGNRLHNLGRLLYCELTGEHDEPIVAFRNNKRWVQTYEPFAIHSMDKAKGRFRQHGVYWIIGGLGQLGIQMASYFARQYQSKLVLTGRTCFPERSDWPMWLHTHSDGDAISLKIRAIQEMEAHGAQVLLVKADAADLREMEQALTVAEQQFGAVDGVIHAAAAAEGFRFIKESDIGDFERHFTAKLHSLLVLEKLFASRSPDFCLLMSSLASVLGGVGMAAYAAANAVLDSYVLELNRRGRPYWTAINWDGWATGDTRVDTVPRTSGLSKLEIEIDEGMEALELALSLDEERIIVSTADFQLRHQMWIKETNSRTPLDLPDNSCNEALRDRPDQLAAPYAAPSSSIQEKLEQMWQKALGYRDIGINDNFFELGGDSLKAIHMISAIHRAFQRKVTLSAFMESPTIAALAAFIERGGQAEERAETLPAIQAKPYYPLSSAQKRLFVVHQLEPNSNNYNLPFVFQVDGNNIHIDKLNNVFRALIQRHEALRTAFVLVDDEPMQKIEPAAEFSLEYVDVSDAYVGASDAEPTDMKTEAAAERMHVVIQDIVFSFVRPFDLSQAPLIRVLVIKVEPGKHVIAIDMHHIVSDGVTLKVLMSEFRKLYNDEALSLPSHQYKDYSEWQHRQHGKDSLREQEKFWLQQFAEPVPEMRLPLDYKRQPLLTYEGDQVEFDFSEELTQRLKNLALKHGATPFTLLFSLLNVLVFKLSQQTSDHSDIVIGTPVAGRTSPEFENVAGLFLNYLPLRNKFSSQLTFTKLLHEVTKNAIHAFDNQDYQFDDLLEQLKLAREANRNPLYDIIFIYQNVDVPDLEMQGMTIRPFPYKNRTSKLDLNLEGMERGSVFHFIWEYNIGLFKADTIKTFISYFVRIAERAAAQPDATIATIAALTGEHTNTMLTQFNDDLEDE